jgi:hypothetical protein
VSVQESAQCCLRDCAIEKVLNLSVCLSVCLSVYLSETALSKKVRADEPHKNTSQTSHFCGCVVLFMYAVYFCFLVLFMFFFVLFFFLCCSCVRCSIVCADIGDCRRWCAVPRCVLRVIPPPPPLPLSISQSRPLSLLSHPTFSIVGSKIFNFSVHQLKHEVHTKLFKFFNQFSVGVCMHMCVSLVLLECVGVCMHTRVSHSLLLFKRVRVCA